MFFKGVYCCMNKNCRFILKIIGTDIEWEIEVFIIMMKKRSWIDSCFWIRY